jgi:ketosteroid isomerase-like protein
MRTAILPLMVLVTAASHSLPQDSRVIEELIRLENEWALAVQQADTAALRLIIADDYFGTTASGGIQNKQDYLADFISGDRRTFSLTTEDLKVRVYGETAVLTHGGRAEGEYRGRSTRGAYRWTHVLVKRDGRWQALANHVTRLEDR